MKKIILVGIAGAALMAVTPATAADSGPRPVYKAPQPAMVPVRVFSWTGCYIGGNIGWGWGRETVSIPDLGERTGVPALASVSLGPVSGNTSGVLGGGQIGCNYQFAANGVIGVEGDGSAADIKGDVHAPPVTFVVPPGDFLPPLPPLPPFPPGAPFPPGPVAFAASFHAKTHWLASLTGRLGYAAGPWLLYAKGGVVWAGDKYSADLPAFNEHLKASVTRPGWTVGGGIEWAFWDNWSAKVEYDFYDFGTNNVILPGTIFGVPTVVSGIDIEEKISVVKFGVNYRFGSVVNGAY